MSATCDGPASRLFKAVRFKGNAMLRKLPARIVSAKMVKAAAQAPQGKCICQGVAFDIPGRIVLASDQPVQIALGRVKAAWLLVCHTADVLPKPDTSAGDEFAARREAMSNVHGHLGDYVLVYADGSEARTRIVRRHQVSSFTAGWGAACSEAVAQHKVHPVRAHHEQTAAGWGWSQTRAKQPDMGVWVNWIWAWENPYPQKMIVGLRVEPNGRPLVISAISAGTASAHPLRWESRRKALVRLPRGVTFDPQLDEHGLLKQIQLDLGQVISAQLQPGYDNRHWERGYNNQLPARQEQSVLIEYTSHPDAVLRLPGGKKMAVGQLERGGDNALVRVVPPAEQRVTISVVEEESGQPVAVKLHVHGADNEYLAPVDRHRIPNNAWFEDYSADFVHAGLHRCTYIPGRTTMDLPVGKVYIEVSKGFEIRPVRQEVRVTRAMHEITIKLSRVLDWRSLGWVTADTHVHFLSPQTALLEGSAEGVNVVNLLASQWGELMTNVGDFDGKTVHGAREAGGDGEYLVRVGTENRQHVLGHISLLGYNGPIIAPMTTGGPDESALGDPVEVLLTQWAQQCRQQDGVVIIPHFPNPRSEHAATIVTGEADGVEMTSWGDLYSGIDPNSLADWYRYLNCGYFVAAVGGTDKMSANTAVGTVRTYAQLEADQAFTFDNWKQAVRKGRTFVTYGPLIEFTVDGHVPGSRIEMSASGGTVHVTWRVASVTVPMTRVDLIVNGVVRESVEVDPQQAEGSFSVKVERSSWLALLVRGHYADRPAIVAAHSSPVMVQVAGSAFSAAADALTILEQIEGAMAYMDTIGTRAQTATWKRMRLLLSSAHRSVHNRMHQMGQFHQHTPTEHHPEHEK